MLIRAKKTNEDGVVRLETRGEVRDVLIKEDFLHPEKECISICYRGRNSSGIVDITQEELETIYESVKKRMKLVKGIKKIPDAGQFF